MNKINLNIRIDRKHKTHTDFVHLKLGDTYTLRNLDSKEIVIETEKYLFPLVMDTNYITILSEEAYLSYNAISKELQALKKMSLQELVIWFYANVEKELVERMYNGE